MTRQVLHVLKQKRPRLLIADDARNLEEEGALRLVFEARGAAHRLLFRDAREREGLTGKAREQHVEIGYVGGGDLADVARRGLTVVHAVSLLGKLVPLAGEDTASAQFLEGHSDAANACEEIAIGKGGIRALTLIEGCVGPERRDEGALRRRGARVPRLPPPHGPLTVGAHPERGGELPLGETKLDPLLCYVGCTELHEIPILVDKRSICPAIVTATV